MFNALTLTPALCGQFLKPHSAAKPTRFGRHLDAFHAGMLDVYRRAIADGGPPGDGPDPTERIDDGDLGIGAGEGGGAGQVDRLTFRVGSADQDRMRLARVGQHQ